MSVAAEARARAEEKARQAAEAASAEQAKAPRKAVRPPAQAQTQPEPPAPDWSQTRAVSPAARRRMLLVARSGAVIAGIGVALPGGLPSPVNDAGAPVIAPEAARLLNQLDNDRRALKQVQSTERKIAAKRDLLAPYLDFARGVMAHPPTRTRLDEIAVTAMIWAIDIGEYEEALPIADWMLRHGVDRLPGIDRTTATFVTEEIAMAAIAAYRGGDDAASAFRPGVLSAVEDLVEIEDQVRSGEPRGGKDMPDQVRAKLQKAIGMAVLHHGSPDDEADLRRRREEALKRFRRAVQLHDAVGVKKEIEQLERLLEKTAPPPTGDA